MGYCWDRVGIRVGDGVRVSNRVGDRAGDRVRV